MNVSDAGLQLIASWEGLRNDLYDDGGPGRGNATIGVGHLVHYGPIDGRAEEAPFVHGLTDAECYELLDQDVQRFVDALNRYVTVPLSQNQADAMIDFAFNCGEGALAQVAGVVNVGGDVCAELRRYVHAGGVTLDALVRRREAECAMFGLEDEMTQEERDAFAAMLTQLSALGKKIDDFGKLEAITLPLIAAGDLAGLQRTLAYIAAVPTP